MILLSGSKFIIIKVLAILEYKIQVQWWVLLGNVFVGILDREKFDKWFLDILPLILVILCEQFMLTLYISVVNLAFVFDLFMERIREITMLTIVI